MTIKRRFFGTEFPVSKILIMHEYLLSKRTHQIVQVWSMHVVRFESHDGRRTHHLMRVSQNEAIYLPSEPDKNWSMPNHVYGRCDFSINPCVGEYVEMQEAEQQLWNRVHRKWSNGSGYSLMYMGSSEAKFLRSYLHEHYPVLSHEWCDEYNLQQKLISSAAGKRHVTQSDEWESIEL